MKVSELKRLLEKVDDNLEVAILQDNIQVVQNAHVSHIRQKLILE